MIWKRNYDLEVINRMNHNTMVEQLGIEFTEVGPDYVKASMPVDHRTVQPMGLLHGGASAALAETMGSVAGLLCLEEGSSKAIVGTELSCSHLRSVREGRVMATARPHRIGRRVQVWEIKIEDDNSRLICVSRLTIMVVGE